MRGPYKAPANAQRSESWSLNIFIFFQELCYQIFSYLETIPSNLVLSPRHPLLTAAACKLIAASIALEHIDYHSEGKLPSWRKIVEFGLTSKDVPVQEAAAEAMAAISKLLDCSAVTQR